MKHSTWLQNRTPAWANDGKSPYQVKTQKKLNIAGIQESGATAYVKDLKARKLDARAKKGQFVAYDSESKGYRIYWPEKRSITVEHNVVFNQDDIQKSADSTIIYGKAQSEGGSNKVIQAPQNDVQEPENKENNDQQSEDKLMELIISSPSNQPQPQPNSQTHNEEQPSNTQYGRSHRQRPPTGIYKTMNDSLVTAVVFANKGQDDKEPDNIHEDYDDHYNLPPDIALIGYASSDPKMLDEALHGLNAKEWQEALDYKINQLEKHGTWVVQDLPPGQAAIPCSEVIRVKRGPNGEVQSYRVRIVARGHRQVKGVNYMETFSAAAKMPTVHVVLMNAAHQDWEIEHIDIKSVYLDAPLKEEIYICNL